MFERFTDRARRVMVLAQSNARTLEHNYVGTEHILLGLLEEGEAVAAKALNTLGISFDDVHDQIEKIIGKGHKAPPGQIPFTPRAKKNLELSLREALNLGHNYIGTEHLLLGLLAVGDGIATQILVELGTELDVVRTQVMDILGLYRSQEKVPASESPKSVHRSIVGTYTNIRTQLRNLENERVSAQIKVDQCSQSIDRLSADRAELEAFAAEHGIQLPGEATL